MSDIKYPWALAPDWAEYEGGEWWVNYSIGFIVDSDA